MSNGGCGQICTDTTPGYTCSCYPGYALNPDGMGCSGMLWECQWVWHVTLYTTIVLSMWVWSMRVVKACLFIHLLPITHHYLSLSASCVYFLCGIIANEVGSVPFGAHLCALHQPPQHATCYSDSCHSDSKASAAVGMSCLF